MQKQFCKASIASSVFTCTHRDWKLLTNQRIVLSVAVRH